MTPTAGGVDRYNLAVAGLDAWLEGLRAPEGYGGPVVHWWQQSLLYTGAALDWRYEGIITGYLSLWERTGEDRWLARARRAGDDLVRGQLPDGHYPASGFEANPSTAGTPHEASCDAALLRLALALRHAGDGAWATYARCAERNLREFYVARLWDPDTRSFTDGPGTDTFVPNKAACASEAMFLLAEVTGDAEPVERYALPTLERVSTYQVTDGGTLNGAIAQNSLGGRRVNKYFPYYIARCIPGLLAGYRWTRQERLVDCALGAMRFIARWTGEDGSLSMVVYPQGRVSRCPSWVAPLGDVLLAARALEPYGYDVDPTPTEDYLLGGQDATGAIQTARGFSGQASGRPADLPDVRDLLHVAGWCDKAFRYLATRAGPGIPEGQSDAFEADCTFRGQRMRFLETPDRVEVRATGAVAYRWRKGEPWASVAAPAFWLR